MDEFLFAPVLGGLWTHSEVVRDVFDIDDLLDAHEILEVREENRRRAEEAARLRERGMM
ncbi:hypothetical protein NDK47_24060 [Brevibacillus ruminantium]|uniref:Uncharacterized protein n=1 Tax=Brevibacillus ruminantium TaxID=2950604 RepID=A0ABY4WE95_9BACL|nr:hypothetical protein [Brevibacillus ruminantium]USG65161.1 hypothetical protein NDK47_24060 [Brevibacillus ruminantium]